jgi:hypothetical protein
VFYSVLILNAEIDIIDLLDSIASMGKSSRVTRQSDLR